METKFFTGIKEAKNYAAASTTDEFSPTIYVRHHSASGVEYAVAGYPAPELDGDDWEEYEPSGSGTPPNTSVVLSDEELRFVREHYAGQKSRAIHDGLRRLMEEIL